MRSVLFHSIRDSSHQPPVRRTRLPSRRKIQRALSGTRSAFLSLWKTLHDPKNGYFSASGLPYHSRETFIIEAPDYGHETTSEALSYWLWLEAKYGHLTGDWSKLTAAWDGIERYAIPDGGRISRPIASTTPSIPPATRRSGRRRKNIPRRCARMSRWDKIPSPTS